MPARKRKRLRLPRWNRKILAAAKRVVGQPMWLDYSHTVENGRLGCAASVTKVLALAGLPAANSDLVTDLVAQLRQSGFRELPLAEARAGDLVYGTEPGFDATLGGGHAHVGVVGQNGDCYNNRSSTGLWSQDKLLEVFNAERFGDQRWVLRAPYVPQRRLLAPGSGDPKPMRTFMIRYSIPGSCDCCGAALSVPYGGANPGEYSLELPEGLVATAVRIADALQVTLGAGRLEVRLRQRRGSNRQWAVNPLYNTEAFAEEQSRTEFSDGDSDFYWHVFSFALPVFRPAFSTWWAELEFVEAPFDARPQGGHQPRCHNSALLKVRLSKLE